MVGEEEGEGNSSQRQEKYLSDDEMFVDLEHEAYLHSFYERQESNCLIASSTQNSSLLKSRRRAKLRAKSALSQQNKIARSTSGHGRPQVQEREVSVTSARSRHSNLEHKERIQEVQANQDLVLESKDFVYDASGTLTTLDFENKVAHRTRYLSFLNSERHGSWDFPDYNYDQLEETVS
jgi:hypothetical protein